MLFAADLLNCKIFGSANIRHCIAHLFGEFEQTALIFAKDLHRDLRVNARDQFVVAGLNNL